jgi:hypothetical protein
MFAPASAAVIFTGIRFSLLSGGGVARPGRDLLPPLGFIVGGGKAQSESCGEYESGPAETLIYFHPVSLKNLFPLTL